MVLIRLTASGVHRSLTSAGGTIFTTRSFDRSTPEVVALSILPAPIGAEPTGSDSTLAVAGLGLLAGGLVVVVAARRVLHRT